MSKKSSRRQPTISLCVIAKNEEEFIAACLDSAKSFVDEMVVVDTDSTDGTVEIAKAHGARLEFFERCDDFAAGGAMQVQDGRAPAHISLASRGRQWQQPRFFATRRDGGGTIGIAQFQ